MIGSSRRRSLLCGVLGAFCLGGLLPTSAWAQHQPGALKVRLVSTEFPPYYASDLPGQGILGALVVDAFHRAGYAATIEFMPWARALQEAQRGYFDGIVGIWHSEERARNFAFSEPTAANEIGYYLSVVNQFDRKRLETLDGLIVGTVRDYRNPDVITRLKPKTEETVDDATNLRKLAAGRIDVALVDRRLAEHLLKTSLSNLRGKVIFSGRVIDTLPLYVAFSKSVPGYEAKLNALNRGLVILKTEGRFPLP